MRGRSWCRERSRWSGWSGSVRVAPARRSPAELPELSGRGRMAAGQPASYTIRGEHARRAALRLDHPAAVAGGDVQPHRLDFRAVDRAEYSRARDVAAAGFPTFAIDGIGTAETKPAPAPSGEVILEVAAYVAHEVIDVLDNGSSNPTRFRKVIEVGDSLGSTTARQEPISYQDVDGRITSSPVRRLPDDQPDHQRCSGVLSSKR
jgi:hypothetical protein